MFQQVKQAVNIVEVCEFYGINLNRSYKAKCPFHNENTPSFSISPKKQIFHCFGCGEGGDVITLVAKLFCLTPLDACKKINEDFRLGIIPGKVKTKSNKKSVQAFKEWAEDTEYRLTEFRRKLFLNDEDTEYLDYLLDFIRDDPLDFFKTYGRRFDVKWCRETVDACFNMLPVKYYAKVVLNIDYNGGS